MNEPLRSVMTVRSGTTGPTRSGTVGPGPTTVTKAPATGNPLVSYTAPRTTPLSAPKANAGKTQNTAMLRTAQPATCRHPNFMAASFPNIVKLLHRKFLVLNNHRSFGKFVGDLHLNVVFARIEFRKRQ